MTKPKTITKRMQGPSKNGVAKGRRAAVRTSPDPAPPDEIRVSDVTETVPLSRLKPARINDKIYKPVDPNDATTIDLGEEIVEKGLLEPIVATPDDVIVSGHRRRAACEAARLTAVKVRRINILSTDPRFESYVVAFNSQRVKS